MRRLTVNPGTDNAWEIPLSTGILTLGRNEDNDFVINHPSVSGNHCQLLVMDTAVTVKDLGSTGGTIVGVSFAQALDRAKVDWLRQCGIGVASRNFKTEKANLRDAPLRLWFSDASIQRYKRLWLGFREDQLSTAEKAVLADYQSIIKDKEKFNEHHRIGNFAPARTAA